MGAAGVRERMAAKKKTPPWEKKTPKKRSRSKLTTSQKTSAKGAAKKAGRRYPNLIDNMRAAKKK